MITVADEARKFESFNFYLAPAQAKSCTLFFKRHINDINNCSFKFIILISPFYDWYAPYVRQGVFERKIKEFLKEKSPYNDFL